MWTLVEGALFGLGVGVIVSTVAPEIPPVWSLGFGVLVIAIGIFRVFPNKIVNLVVCVVLAVLVFGGWRMIPKHDPPATKKDVEEALGSYRNPTATSADDRPISKTELTRMLQKYMTTPQHTTLGWAPATGAPAVLYPFNVGEQTKMNMGFSNYGDYKLLSSTMRAKLLLAPGEADQSNVFKKSVGEVMKERPITGGVMVPHQPGIGYFTFNGPVLTTQDVDDLTSIPSRKMICGIGVVDWTDATGKYRTDFNQCLFRQMDGSYNWHLGNENDRETKIK